MIGESQIKYYFRTGERLDELEHEMTVRANIINEKLGNIERLLEERGKLNDEE